MPRFRIAVICIMFLLVTSLAFAGEIDILVKQLVEKGILTEREADTILSETKEKTKKDFEAGKLDTLPKWVQNTKFSGDLRFRFENKERAILADVQNFSYRFRWGFESKVNDKVKVGARLATGSSAKPTTREQTVDDGADLESIWLDLAYLEYSPTKKLKVIGGRIKNPFYATHDLIWDGDVTPEGGVLQYKDKTTLMNQPIDYFLTFAALPLESLDPVIYALQGGLSTDVFERKLKGAMTYYEISGIKNLSYNQISPNNAVKTNKLVTDNFVYDYNILDTSVEYPLIDVELLGKVMPIKLLGGFVKNVAANVEKDNAWLAGFTFGKAGDPGTWQFSYDYRKIEADAVLDFLNDGTFHGGGTNSKGHKYTLTYIPAKNTDLKIWFFNTEKVAGLKSSGETLNTLQVDFTVKF